MVTIDLPPPSDHCAQWRDAAGVETMETGNLEDNSALSHPGRERGRWHHCRLWWGGKKRTKQNNTSQTKTKKNHDSTYALPSQLPLSLPDCVWAWAIYCCTEHLRNPTHTKQSKLQKNTQETESCWNSTKTLHPVRLFPLFWYQGGFILFSKSSFYERMFYVFYFTYYFVFYYFLLWTLYKGRKTTFWLWWATEVGVWMHLDVSSEELEMRRYKCFSLALQGSIDWAVANQGFHMFRSFTEKVQFASHTMLTASCLHSHFQTHTFF